MKTDNSVIEQASELWTESDVRRYAKMKSRNSVYKAIDEGLPIVRIGKLLRFQKSSVIAYFNSLEKKSEGRK